MKYKIVFLITALLTINVVHAQWHFTANISYNCSGVYTSQIHLAEQFSATSFSTKQECESARQSVTMSFSAGDCYLRITTTPCSGSDIGGGGIGIGGISAGEIGVGGSSQGIVSPHSSIAIGEPYFAPSEVQVISNTGQDLEIKLEAMNRSFNSAVNGMKTGDQAFDDIYKKSSKELPKENDGPYTFKSRNEIDWDKPVYVIQPEAQKLDIVSIGDANSNNVQSYFDNSKPLTDLFLDNPAELENLLKSEFEQISGFDLDEIRSKRPEDRTKEEQQALADYEAYRVKEMEQMNRDIEKQIDNTKEKKEIDAAILALDVYGDDKEGYLSKTNYRKIDLELVLLR